MLFSHGSSADLHQSPTLHLLGQPERRALLGSVWSEGDQWFGSTSSSLILGQFGWGLNASGSVMVPKGLPYAEGPQELNAADHRAKNQPPVPNQCDICKV